MYLYGYFIHVKKQPSFKKINHNFKGLVLGFFVFVFLAFRCDKMVFKNNQFSLNWANSPKATVALDPVSLISMSWVLRVNSLKRGQ